MRNIRLDDLQAEIKIAAKNINKLKYADGTTLMSERRQELKSLLMRMKGDWRSWFKAQHSENEDHGVRSHHFMADRWGNMETVTDFIFVGSKITADGDCTHDINRHFLLGRKAITILNNIKKQRHHLTDKGP